MCRALGEVDPTDILDTYWSGRCTLVSRRDHIPVYDSVFRRFFLDEHLPEPDDPRVKMRASANAHGVLEIPDTESSGEGNEDNGVTLGYMSSPADVWRNKRFADCSPEELAHVRRLISKIRIAPPRRRSRRRRASDRGRHIHLRRMTLEMMRHHGEPNQIVWSIRRQRPRPLTLILDVSGSMADHSRNLLQFAYSTRRATRRVEVFCFGTRLTRITQQLDRRRPDEAMRRAAEAVFDWDGGTRIGDCLEEFVKRWARRGITRGGIVVICSDGLDRGDPERLEHALEQLSRLSHRLVWLNPHYRDGTDAPPNTLAMLVAEPYIDTMMSGRDLASLEAFAELLPTLR